MVLTFNPDNPSESASDSDSDGFGYNKDFPPTDDVCPICFDAFTLPCRSNCGHWFCGSCIIHFWKFKSSIHPCKCPLCYSRIVNLKPEEAGGDDIDALKKVHHYNALYSSSSRGGIHRIRFLPIFFKYIFQVLIDPDILRCAYYVLRLLGLLFGFLYERLELEFMPMGGLGIQKMFDTSASILVVTLFLVGIGYRWMVGVQARHCAANYIGVGLIFVIFVFTNTRVHSKFESLS